MLTDCNSMVLPFLIICSLVLLLHARESCILCCGCLLNILLYVVFFYRYSILANFLFLVWQEFLPSFSMWSMISKYAFVHIPLRHRLLSILVMHEQVFDKLHKRTCALGLSLLIQTGHFKACCAVSTL